MTDRRRKIIHDLTRWAAASAARQGSTLRGHKWYQHIDQINLTPLLEAETGLSLHAFEVWHQTEVTKLSESSGVVVGWAAKIVNMVTKIRIYIANQGDPGLKSLIHPPIDNQLIDAIRGRYPLRGENREQNAKIKSLCDIGKPISRIATYDHYGKVISGLRLVAQREGCTLFEVESLWTG